MQLVPISLSNNPDSFWDFFMHMKKYPQQEYNITFDIYTDDTCDISKREKLLRTIRTRECKNMWTYSPALKKYQWNIQFVHHDIPNPDTYNHITRDEFQDLLYEHYDACYQYWGDTSICEDDFFTMDICSEIYGDEE